MNNNNMMTSFLMAFFFFAKLAKHVFKTAVLLKNYGRRGSF
jgi:hypothetical protein